MESMVIKCLGNIYGSVVNCGTTLGVEVTRFENERGQAIIVRETVPAKSKYARHTEISVEYDREAGSPVYSVREFTPEHSFDNSWVPSAVEWVQSVDA